MARDVARDWMWSEACEMLARAERMHREIFRPAATQTRQVAWEPPVDILETEREVLVLVALPGVDGDSVQAVDRGRRPRHRRHARLSARTAHRDHPPARTAARALRSAAAAAGRPLQRREPRRGQRFDGDHVAESRNDPWLKLKCCHRASPDRAARPSPPLPADALIIVPVRNTVLFPGLVLPITLGRPKSIAAAQQAVRDQRQVGILMQRDRRARRPDPDRHASHGHGRQHRPLHHRARRHAPSRLPGRAALSGRRIPERLAVLRRARRANPGAGHAHSGDRGAVPQPPGQTVEALQLLPQAPAELRGRRPVGRGARRSSPISLSPTWT